jgi:Right handed beta helix region/Domain of unknown function DUF11
MIKAFLAAVLLATAVSAQVADVRLAGQTSRPTNLDPGDLGSMTLAMQNLGPDAARNVRVAFRASAGVQFTRVAPECRVAGVNTIVCPMGDLAANDITYSGADYQMPFAAGTHTVTATLLSDTPDPVTANNTFTLTYDTAQMAGVYVFVSSFNRRIDPGQSTIVSTSIRDARGPLAAPFPAGTIIDARFSVTGGATIEAIDAPPYWSCTLAGTTATCRATAPGGACCGELQVHLRASPDRAGGVVRLDAEAAVQLEAIGLPARDDASIEVFRIAPVTNANDSGPGSLRAAIEEVNAHCSTHPCRIAFDLPGAGPHTIGPASPLPPIVADRIFVRAEQEEVVLDGTAAGTGLEMHVACEGVISGLTFRNFHATEGLWYTMRRACSSSDVQRSFLINGNRFERNRRGLILGGAPGVTVLNNLFRENSYSAIWMWRGTAFISSNQIEDNGASGIFLGPGVRETHILFNVIRRNREMGVAVAYGATHIDIGSNGMSGNGGLGIDWGLDGVTPQRASDAATETNAPTLLSAVYDAAANRTRVTLTLRTQLTSAFPNGSVVVELFANDGSDGDGERPLGFATVAPTDGTPVTMTVPGDQRGKWINATASRAAQIYLDRSTPFGDIPSTSELSNSILAQ